MVSSWWLALAIVCIKVADPRRGYRYNQPCPVGYRLKLRYPKTCSEIEKGNSARGLGGLWCVSRNNLKSGRWRRCFFMTSSPCRNINRFWQMRQYQKILIFWPEGITMVVYEIFFFYIFQVNLKNKETVNQHNIAEKYYKIGRAKLRWDIWELFNNSPNITHLSPINYIITHMTIHFFWYLKICKYQGHPYTILRCLNVVRISLIYNIFLQYYFG